MEKPNPTPTPEQEKREKELAALSYVWIFSAVILIARRDSAFIGHHARRGFVLFLLSIVLWLFPTLRYGEFLVLALALYGFITAAMGNENPTPILSEIADGTLRIRHLKFYWHHVIGLAKPGHTTPELLREIREEKKGLTEQEREIEKGKKMMDMEEQKLSSLFRRVNEDEKRLDELTDEVHTLEKKMEEARKV